MGINKEEQKTFMGFLIGDKKLLWVLKQHEDRDRKRCSIAGVFDTEEKAEEAKRTVEDEFEANGYNKYFPGYYFFEVEVFVEGEVNTFHGDDNMDKK